MTSFNGVVLLAGQTPRADLKAWPNRPPPSAARQEGTQRTAGAAAFLAAGAQNDAWLTTKIKTQMLTDASHSRLAIKVVTENGIVYLLGLLTQAEATRATNLVQGVGGVQKIVKLFEYID